jgi:hypothetical protein
MTSIERNFNVTTLTNGTFVGIPVAATTIAYVYSNFTAPTSVGGAGSVFDYQTGATQAADALLATAGLSNAMADPREIAAGDLFRDMGDRYVFSANGSTVAVVSAVQPLTNLDYEGAENKMYLTTWVAQTLGTSNQTVIGVARV